MTRQCRQACQRQIYLWMGESNNNIVAYRV